MSVSNQNSSIRSHDHHSSPCRTPTPPCRSPAPFRLRGWSLGARSRRKEENTLIDLVLKSQSQRLENQRAPISLLQEPGPGCKPGPGSESGLEPEYGDNGLEDRHLDPQQESLLSLIYRVQSKRIDEQRVHFQNDT